MPGECGSCGGTLETPIALVDYYMPVGETGLQFVAALQAQMLSWGPSFSTVATQAAYRRAGSTLAHMALVAGSTFQFIRNAIPFTQAEAAAFLGVTVPQIVAWEDGVSEVPLDLWYHLADKVCQVDRRAFTPYLTLPTRSIQAYVVRVHPDVPFQGQPPSSSPCHCPC